MKLFKGIVNRIPTLLMAAMMVFGFWATSARATNLTLSDTPLYLGGNAEANIMFTLDDSGSMQWEIMPSSITFFAYLYPHPITIYGSGDYANQIPDFNSNNALGLYLRTPTANVMWYNPKTRYDPWLQQDGTPFPPAPPNCAPHNPNNPGLGCINLTQTNNSNQWWYNSSVGWQFTNKSFWPAVYNTYIPGTPPIPFSFGGSPENTPGNYTQTLIQPGPGTYPGGANRTDCVVDPTHATCTYTEEIQNFANWYTYFRSRVLTARAGVGRAFAQQGSNMRVGFAAINQGNKTIDGVTSSSSLITGVRRFAGAGRINWFNQLYGHPIPAAGTPLRRAMDSAGRYYQRTDNKGPWGTTPGTNDTTPQSTCRQSYHILMTDGQWNGGQPFTSGARQNVDGQTGPSITTPTAFQYSPSRPYQDAWSGTLGDVAMYFWNRDLRPSLANQVPTNVFDPAYWQHMVNFTVGLGVTGNLNSDPNSPGYDLPNLTTGAKSWGDPNPGANSNAKVDDLWHAALNSRGTFFSAQNPTQFANGLSAVLNNINSRTSTASSVSVDSASISSSSSVFQARFDSGTWAGTVVSIPFDLATGVFSAPAWDAQTQVSAQNYDTGRKIVTFDPSVGGGGMPFRWGSLTTAQQNALNINPDTGLPDSPTPKGQARLDYLRGKTGISGFRLRPQGVLGDIVHSGPVFVGAPSSHYPDFWGVGEPETSVLYSNFVSTNASRQGMVYAGANDGMLHAFDAATGNETFAYVPNAVFNNLNRLTSTNYGLSHRYYVDGQSTVSDVFFGGAWHTVLIGSLRGGGQGIYALDITDPTAASEASVATNKVLWEFTDANDADMGYTFGRVSIVRLHNGKWAAVFGNGYNNMVDNGNDGAVNDSATGNAVLYIVDIETGALIKRIDTLQGLAQSTAAPPTPNGLSSPLAIDTNGDSITDYFYAGDLQGNMWKFDVTNSNVNSWKSDYLTSPGNAPMPLFTATDSGGGRQPITTAPDVVLSHPTGTGWMVYFGTGKYMEPGDNNISGQPSQTFYGIWDKGTAPPAGFSRNHLLQQKILQEVTTASGSVRAISNKGVNPAYQINWHTGAGLPTGSPPTTHLGWYIDLINTDPATAPLNNYGEKLITRPFVISGKVIFNTFLPPSDPCAFGGDGWLMLMDAVDGGGLSLGAGGFDVNGDNVVDSQDYVQVNYDANGDGVVDANDKIVAGGIKSGGGLGGITMVHNQNIGNGNSRVLSGQNQSGAGGGAGVGNALTNFGLPQGGRKSWIRLQ